MSKDYYSVDDFFYEIHEHHGLYGLFSVTGLGKRELFMYICHMLSLRKRRPLVFSLELSKEQWKKQMMEYGLITEGVMVEDSSWKLSEMKTCIKKCTPTIVFIDYLALIRDEDVIVRLKELSVEYSLSIVVAANLARNSGDNDPVYRRPQLYDLIYTYHNDKTIGDFKHDMSQYTAIMLLHTSHDWYRNIGIGRALNICNEAEITCVTFDYRRPRTVFFDFSDIIPEKSERDTSGVRLLLNGTGI